MNPNNPIYIHSIKLELNTELMAEDQSPTRSIEDVVSRTDTRNEMRAKSQKMFEDVTEYVQGELESNVAEYELLTNMNNTTASKYKQMTEKCEEITKQSDTLNESYEQLLPNFSNRFETSQRPNYDSMKIRYPPVSSSPNEIYPKIISSPTETTIDTSNPYSSTYKRNSVSSFQDKYKSPKTKVLREY